jgi:hypothetical protein
MEITWRCKHLTFMATPVPQGVPELARRDADSEEAIYALQTDLDRRSST